MFDDKTALEGLFLGNRMPLGSFEVSVKYYLPARDLLGNIFICGAPESGKTVIGKTIIEEAALNGISSIVIDLRGDLSSLGLLIDGNNVDRLARLYAQEGKGDQAAHLAQERYESQLGMLAKFGLTEYYIKKIKERADFAVFTPRSDKGLPLAISALASAPFGFGNLYAREPKVVDAMIGSLVESLVFYLYPESGVDQTAGEKDFLAALILYCWQNNIELDGLEGMVLFMRFVVNPPFKNIGVKSLDQCVNVDKRKELFKRLSNFMSVTEKTWYKGLPLDIDLLCGRSYRTDKSYVSVINLSEMGSFVDQCFIISRLIYAVHSWMRKLGPSTDPRLIFCLDGIADAAGNRVFYPADPPAPSTKFALELLMKNGGHFGVGSVLSSQTLDHLDFAGLCACDTWITGGMPDAVQREKFIAGVWKAGVKFDNVTSYINFPKTGEFLIKMASEEVALVRGRWLAGVHCYLPSSFLQEVINRDVKINAKRFYVSDTMPGEEWPLSGPGGGRVLIPETIFENFNFGVNEAEKFVLEMSPEDAIKICLEELSKEGISADEITFKNVQVQLARGHRADWRVEAWKRDPMGHPVERIQESGVYSRFDTHVPMDDKAKEKSAQLMMKEPYQRCPDICRKVVVIGPEPVKLVDLEVRKEISRDMDVSPREVHVIVNERDVALAWEFIMEYRRKSIECVIDILTREPSMTFPVFSKDDALDEIHHLYPQLQLSEKDITQRFYWYVVNYDTDDNSYTFRVSMRSGKLVTQKIFITEKKARQLAEAHMKQEPFSVWRSPDGWNFYYLDGNKLLIEGAEANIVSRKAVSSAQAESIAYDVGREAAGDEKLSLHRKEYKDGVWLVVLSSRRWTITVHIDENGELMKNVELQQEYCLEEARGLLAGRGIPMAVMRAANSWGAGWEFEFLSPFGYYTIRVDQHKKEIFKSRFSREGIEHFLKEETGGEVLSLVDRSESWDIILKRPDGTYRVEVSKQDGNIVSAKKKQFLIWNSIDVATIRKKQIK